MPETPHYLLVDGHSVIHAWEDLRRLHRSSSKRHLAREQLMHRLRTVQDVMGERVVVVFDGTGSRTTEEREPDGLQVFYADPATTADTILERLAVRYGKETHMRVASADGMVRETIHAAGAEWMSPEALQALCEQAETRLQRRIRRD